MNLLGGGVWVLHRPGSSLGYGSARGLGTATGLGLARGLAQSKPGPGGGQRYPFTSDNRSGPQTHWCAICSHSPTGTPDHSQHPPPSFRGRRVQHTWCNTHVAPSCYHACTYTHTHTHTHTHFIIRCFPGIFVCEYCKKGMKKRLYFYYLK